jgi:peptidoglycan/LPS O-acetylase OafA/YrhL
MKRTILGIFAGIFILFGLTGFAIEMEELGQGSNPDLIFGVTLSVCILITGISMVRAATADYRLSWSLFCGGLLTIFGVATIAMAVDDALAGQTADVAVGAVVAVMFIVPGILLLRSGHRHHKRSVACCIAAQSALRDQPVADEPDCCDPAAGKDPVAAGRASGAHRK